MAVIVTAAGALMACGTDSVSSSGTSLLRDAPYQLRTVDGAPLPTRFVPLEDSQSGPEVRLDSGTLTFKADGRATGVLNGTNDVAAITRFFEGAYVEDGPRVLIYANGDAAPDTVSVMGNTLTVRAQFLRTSSAERYVALMTYTP